MVEYWYSSQQKVQQTLHRFMGNENRKGNGLQKQVQDYLGHWYGEVSMPPGGGNYLEGGMSDQEIYQFRKYLYYLEFGAFKSLERFILLKDLLEMIRDYFLRWNTVTGRYLFQWNPLDDWGLVAVELYT